MSQVRTSSEKTTIRAPIVITAAGAYLAEVFPLSSALIATEPIAIPIENSAVSVLYTRGSAASAFLIRGGNRTISTVPIIQKKLIARMARNSRGMCIVALTSRQEAVIGL